MKRRYVALAALIAVAAAAGLYLASGTKHIEAGVPPVPVEATAVVLKDVPLYVSGLGTVVPLQTVAVRPQVDGQIMTVRFREGQHVRANDVLVELDSRALRAKLKQADGQLKHDQVLLANAQHDLSRYRQALDTGTVTQQLIDTQAATVAQDKATVLSDQGAFDAAKVQLGYCTIRSPATGVAGLRQVDAGNLVQTTDAGAIVTIVAVTPISVVFTVPQRDILRVTKALHGGGKLPVAALDSANTNVLAGGTLEALDNVVDPATGTIRLKAIFQNDKEALFPGEFVHARMRVGLLKQVPVVPSQAVLHGAKGDFVFIAENGRTAKRVSVKTGADSRGETPLTGGDIKPGDLVITDGGARVADHAAVQVRVVDAASRRGAGAAPASGAPPASAPDGAGASRTPQPDRPAAASGASGTDGADAADASAS